MWSRTGFLPSTMFCRSIHVVMCIRTYSFSGTNNIPLHGRKTFCLSFPVIGDLIAFLFLALMNLAAQNICVQVSWVLLLSGCPGGELLGEMKSRPKADVLFEERYFSTGTWVTARGWDCPAPSPPTTQTGKMCSWEGAFCSWVPMRTFWEVKVQSKHQP